MLHFILSHNQFFYLLFILIPQTISTPLRDPSSSSSAATDGSSTTTTSSAPKRVRYSFNLKLTAIIVACVCLGIGIIRVCFLLCRSSRSTPRSFTSRPRRSVIRPHVATIEQNQFKPDLPPAYAEAMANNDFNGSKLPSYDELNREQRSRDATEAPM